MIRRIIDFALYYKYELILTICLFANLYPALPGYLYYASVAGMGIAMYKFKARRTGRTGLALALVFFLLLSSLLAWTLDAKSISLAALLFIALVNSSEEFYRFKYTFMYISLLAYAFTSVINFYAKHAGINFYDGILISTWGSSTGEFSGYTCHPMWLSSACGIGTIFFVYAMIVMYKRGNKKMTYLLGAASLASIWTTMQGGSRAASGISVLCCLFLILNAFESATQKKKILIPIILVGLMTIPSMVTDNAQFARKQGGLSLTDESGQSSRSLLWGARFAEFESSPVFGVGPGVIKIQPVGFEQSTETGSGWLTALAQTGIIGFVLVCMIVYRARLPKYVLKTDSTAALMEAVMLFLCLHSLFEAYMFQVGWYMCFVFWLLVSILDDYKIYGPVPELEESLFGEDETAELYDNDNVNLNPNLNEKENGGEDEGTSYETE